MNAYSTSQTIRTVALREIQVVSRLKAVRISIAIIVVLIIAALVALSYFASKDDADDSTQAMALVGVEASLFPDGSFEFSSLSDAKAAREAVENGTDYALINTGSGYELLHSGSADPLVQATIEQVLADDAMATGLAELGVDRAAFEQATAAPIVEAIDISAAAEQKDDSYYAAIATTLTGIGILMYFIILFAANVGGRICEEKSSKVIEIILATVKPLDFLAGKIIGNLIFGTAASLAIVAIGLVGLKLSDLGKGVSIDYSILPLLVVMFILGMLFFGSLYAAAGSLVARTEDLQATQMPVMLFVFLTLYAPMFGMNALESTIMQVFTWLPPTSLTVAPLEYAAGNINAAQLAGAWGVFLATTVGVMFIVARVYQNAILHSGTRMSWTRALKGTR